MLPSAFWGGLHSEGSRQRRCHCLTQHQQDLDCIVHTLHLKQCLPCCTLISFTCMEPSTMMAKTACSKALLIRLSSEHTAMPNVQILLLCCVNSQTSAYQHGMAYLISASCGHTDKQEVQAGAPVVLPLNNLIIDLGQHVEVVFP